MVLWEVSRFPPDTPPTPEQQRAADDLVARCLEAAKRNRWFEFERGRADGYSPMVSDRRHFQNLDYILDDRVLDPERPEFLMYEPTPGGGRILTGFMFFPQKFEDHGPQIGGPLTVWHFHVWNKEKCFRFGIVPHGDAPPTGCTVGSPGYRSAEMLHVWLLDHPGGRFATQMFLPGEVILKGLRKRRQKHGF